MACVRWRALPISERRLGAHIWHDKGTRELSNIEICCTPEKTDMLHHLGLSCGAELPLALRP